MFTDLDPMPLIMLAIALLLALFLLVIRVNEFCYREKYGSRPISKKNLKVNYSQALGKNVRAMILSEEMHFKERYGLSILSEQTLQRM